MVTPTHALDTLTASQAQKHVTFNESLAALDGLGQLVLRDMDRTEPPLNASEGHAHLVASPATGDWEGREGAIAVRRNSGWAFYTAPPGRPIYVRAHANIAYFDGTDWQVAKLPAVGVGTAPERANLEDVRLAVSGTVLLDNVGGDVTLSFTQVSGSDGKISFEASAGTLDQFGGIAHVTALFGETLQIQRASDDIPMFPINGLEGSANGASIGGSFCETIDFEAALSVSGEYLVPTGHRATATGLPTTDAGLSSGDVWVDGSGNLRIVA